jgi:hypothetical protein
VGAALLEDEWIKQAIAILEARPPKDEQPEKPAKKKTERDLEEAVARIAKELRCRPPNATSSCPTSTPMIPSRTWPRTRSGGWTTWSR